MIIREILGLLNLIPGRTYVALPRAYLLPLHLPCPDATRAEDGDLVIVLSIRLL